jgi:hypothetical protein
MTDQLTVKKFSHLAEAAELRKLAARATKTVEKYEKDFPEHERLPAWKEIIAGVLQVAERLEGNDQIVP